VVGGVVQWRWEGVKKCVLGGLCLRPLIDFFLIFVLVSWAFVCCLPACEFYLISCEVCWAA